MSVLSILPVDAATSCSFAARISSCAASRLSATRCRIATRVCKYKVRGQTAHNRLCEHTKLIRLVSLHSASSKQAAATPRS